MIKLSSVFVDELLWVLSHAAMMVSSLIIIVVYHSDMGWCLLSGVLLFDFVTLAQQINEDKDVVN